MASAHGLHITNLLSIAEYFPIMFDLIFLILHEWFKTFNKVKQQRRNIVSDKLKERSMNQVFFSAVFGFLVPRSISQTNDDQTVIH